MANLEHVKNKWTTVRNTFLYMVGLRDAKNDLPEEKDEGHGNLTILNEGSGYQFRVYGGSFFNRPETLYGVKLAPEINLPYNYKLDINDYSVPSLTNLVCAVNAIITEAERHGEVYIGCYGGFGRTGLVISAVLMACSRCTKEAAVEEVRSYIHPHCVEVPAQHKLLLELEERLQGTTISVLEEYLDSDCN